MPRWEREAMVFAMKAYRSMESKAREMACPNPMLSEEDQANAIADSAFAAAKSNTPKDMMGKSIGG